MSIKTIYANPKWQDILAANQLTTFDQFWELQLQAVDEGNQGRGQNGWSVVCIHSLHSTTTPPKQVVIKRQSNYRTRTLSHPLCGIATFVKEYNFICRYKQLGVPATQAVYCATRRQNGELQAILVTEYLEDYRPLFDLLEDWPQQRSNTVGREHQLSIIHSVATLVAKLHNSGLEHRCLFPKHIFVPNNLEQPSCLIDLEKTRWKPWREWRRVRDLAALTRRTTMLNNKERILFLREYLGQDKLDIKGKKLWHQIAQRRNNSLKKS
jgi:tRNA A-37 threonylcarbamoyl transferase component Bud32